MRSVFILVFSAFQFVSMAQTDDVVGQWTEKRVYQISPDEVWSVDGLENVYISRNGLIEKFDSSGVRKFSQSIKSLGKMTQLVPVNTMKLVHFSEEQQTLCYFDNTLSSLDDCIDLSQEDIVNASMISASGQPNKIWVLDDLNSRLLLLSKGAAQQPQELGNLRGILDIEHVKQIVERNNTLFLLDESRGVYIFDLYGSLLEFVESENALQLDANQEMLFILHEKTLEVRRLKSGETLFVKLPLDEIQQFAFQNRFFFFRTDSGVHKFALQISE